MVLIKRIKIKFLGASYNSNDLIKIYNLKGKLIAKSRLNNGITYISLKDNNFYMVEANINNEYICKVFYVSRYICNIDFILSNILIDNTNRNNTITFLLTDANYINLPIEQGEMVLWQN